jgi:hypothetical protein
MTKGKKEQTALFPIHPLYKVATSITFQNVWDYFSLFFYSTKIPGDIGGDAHKKTDGREKI